MRQIESLTGVAMVRQVRKAFRLAVPATRRGRDEGLRRAAQHGRTRSAAGSPRGGARRGYGFTAGLAHLDDHRQEGNVVLQLRRGGTGRGPTDSCACLSGAYLESTGITLGGILLGALIGSGTRSWQLRFP